MMQFQKMCLYILGMLVMSTVYGSVSAELVRTQRVVAATLGENVSLKCELTKHKDVLQVTWQKTKGQSFENIATYNKRFGAKITDAFRDRMTVTQVGTDVSCITIEGVRKEDEACYSCLFNAYPEGAITGRTCLSVYASFMTAGKTVFQIEVYGKYDRPYYITGLQKRFPEDNESGSVSENHDPLRTPLNKSSNTGQPFESPLRYRKTPLKNKSLQKRFPEDNESGSVSENHDPLRTPLNKSSNTGQPFESPLRFRKTPLKNKSLQKRFPEDNESGSVSEKHDPLRTPLNKSFNTGQPFESPLRYRKTPLKNKSFNGFSPLGGSENSSETPSKNKSPSKSLLSDQSPTLKNTTRGKKGSKKQKVSLDVFVVDRELVIHKNTSKGDSSAGICSSHALHIVL
ncbi:uncharacterized protein LOC117972804 [Acipenser ruthenus]|uniref:uncharacterized protein LOC117972804 n=1 Tax=Acipenser ruthenus TaxID=7906 RepID=UPI0027408E3E|nr:uncharacterized protein LOC117972804 [Acipenser ruthenus]